MNMDREQLATFDRIAREGSFTRAAISLGIGQPAISARIQALEEQVGGTLFTRGRRIALTTLGESFLPFARRALEVLGEGIEAARLAQIGQHGRIRLGSLASLAGGLVGPALSAFVRVHPRVECFVRAGDHERIVALLLDAKPGLTPPAVRKALLSTARDLGPKGRDDQFGAGLADAYGAVQSLAASPASAPVANASTGR